jgi:hypothetical protein
MCRGNVSPLLERDLPDQATLGSRQPGVELDLSADAIEPLTTSSGQRTTIFSEHSRTLSHHTTGPLPHVQAGVGVPSATVLIPDMRILQGQACTKAGQDENVFQL